ncbi:MAG: phage terminase large subunit [Campylobacteraceae bacterium]
MFTKEELKNFLDETKESLRAQNLDDESIKTITRKEFLGWLEEYKNELSIAINEAALNLPADKKDERVKRASRDIKYFAKTYMPHYLTIIGESEFHKYLHALFVRLRIVRGEKHAIAAPRANAKSVWTAIIFVVWCIVFGYRKFIVEISDAIELAEANLEAIKAELEDNPSLKLDFPHAIGITNNWKIGEFTTKNGTKLKAFGSGKRLRGVRHGNKRPDLCIIDDLENDTNVRSRTQRDKLEDWVDEAVLNLSDVSGNMDVLYIGTILHKDSVLSRKLKKKFWNPKVFRSIISYPIRMDMWEVWSGYYINHGVAKAHEFYMANKKEMDEGVVVLWEAALSIEKLMRKRAENRKAFNKEQQNDPQEDNAKFTEAKMHFYKNAPKADFTVMYTDPAGNGKASDFTSIHVLGISKEERKAYILESIVEVMEARTIINKMITFQKQYKCKICGVETNGGGFFLKAWILESAYDKGIHMPLRGVHNRKNKNERIAELELPIENGELLLRKDFRLLINQLEDYPEGDYDDAPDGLHGAYKLSKMERIKKSKNGRRRQAYAKGIKSYFQK